MVVHAGLALRRRPAAGNSIRCLRALQHLFRMGEGLARDLDAAEHASDLGPPAGLVERIDARVRAVTVARLAREQMRMALRRDLRQVGDAQHLALAAEPAQLLPDDFGDRAADARVDFVKHHRGDVIEAECGDFDGEADA